MPEFLKLIPPHEALTLLMHKLPNRKAEEEIVDVNHSVGRITTGEIRAPHPLPNFSRSSMDGYAVRAVDTYGASKSMPGFLSLTKEIPMGVEVQTLLCFLDKRPRSIPEGCCRGMLMRSSCWNKPKDREKARSPFPVLFAPGENVILMGEDVIEGQVVIPAGIEIRPAEVGGCMALGVMSDQGCKKAPDRHHIQR